LLLQDGVELVLQVKRERSAPFGTSLVALQLTLPQSQTQTCLTSWPVVCSVGSTFMHPILFMYLLQSRMPLKASGELSFLIF
jgi:hypothetical protein